MADNKSNDELIIETMKNCLSPGEIEAIDTHKYFLSQKAGYDVGIEYAVQDWLIYHAQQWRKEQMKKNVEEQLKEIQTHKWIESEKAHCDLGNEACLDWIKKYAAQWRVWKNQQVKKK